MIPWTTYQRGDHFGDYSLLRGKPRAGTVRALIDSHLAKIPAPSYEKLIKKSKQIKIQMVVKFLRQISYMKNMFYKEIH